MMRDERPHRSRASRLFTPIVVLGVFTIVAHSLHVPRLIFSIVLIILLWLFICKWGYGPRYRR